MKSIMNEVLEQEIKKKREEYIKEHKMKSSPPPKSKSEPSKFDDIMSSKIQSVKHGVDNVSNSIKSGASSLGNKAVSGLKKGWNKVNNFDPEGSMKSMHDNVMDKVQSFKPSKKNSVEESLFLEDINYLIGKNSKNNRYEYLYEDGIRRWMTNTFGKDPKTIPGQQNISNMDSFQLVNLIKRASEDEDLHPEMRKIILKTAHGELKTRPEKNVNKARNNMEELRVQNLRNQQKGKSNDDISYQEDLPTGDKSFASPTLDRKELGVGKKDSLSASPSRDREELGIGK